MSAHPLSPWLKALGYRDFDPPVFEDVDVARGLERLVKRKTAARFLAKPESWLRYCERHNKIPYYKVGSGIRYRITELDAWLRQCCKVEATAPPPRSIEQRPTATT